MSIRETVSTWSVLQKSLLTLSVTAGAILTIWKLVVPIYAWNHIDSEAMALAQIDLEARQEIIVAVNDRAVESVQDQIAAKERQIIKTQYANDLSDEAKAVLISTYREEIRILKIKETCLLAGNLKC